MIQVKQGHFVTFLSADGVLVGAVNGEPYIVWSQMGGLEPRIPVHVTRLNANIDVAGANVISVTVSP